jgi:8-oxo-dGTP pyrophosphatase MutT (NUDIX family)
MTAKCAHWGTHGAAGLLVVDKGKALLQQRSQGVREPHTWSIPGGARGKDETAEDAALREAAEETGLDPNAVKIVATYTHPCACGWEYVTCVATPIGPSTLRGNWESERLELVPLDDVGKLDLHPGFKAPWPALRDIIRAPDTRPNITQVTERLWTGGDRGRTSMATWLAQLQSAGITHVIDARPHGRADQAYAQAHAPQIGYLLNAQVDEGQEMPDRWFADSVDYALHAMRDPGAQVLVHCQMGWNRGPSLAFAVLLSQGMTPEQARSAIKGARPIAQIRYADDATKWWAELTAPEVYFHGGKGGLHVGDFLLPPTLTGVTTRVDRAMPWGNPITATPEFQRLMQMTHDRENHCVFLTRDILYATEIAARCDAPGAVYQVEPMGSITAGSSLLGIVKEIRCDRARIIAVVDEHVTWDKAVHFATEELARRKATR